MSRYYITLALTVDADNKDDALDKADEFCTYVTQAAMVSPEQGIKHLAFDDRGDGVDITCADDEDDEDA